MLRAENLQIGDFVFCNYTKKNYKVAEIKTVTDDELKIVVYDDDIPLVFRENQIEPISLTPEILEKNGFILDYESGWYWLKELVLPGVEVALYENKDGIIGYDLEINTNHTCCFHFNYVHQLQHALKLCGIEKEIKL